MDTACTAVLAICTSSFITGDAVPVDVIAGRSDDDDVGLNGMADGGTAAGAAAGAVIGAEATLPGLLAALFNMLGSCLTIMTAGGGDESGE